MRLPKLPQTLPQRLLFWLLALRFLVMAVHTTLPFALPEIWRQTITMGVALRYWNRWTVEPPANHWLPAVLESGDTSGVMGMEFPLLNVVTAPAFAWGVSRGRVVARLLWLGVCLLLTLINIRIWKARQWGTVSLEKVMCFVPILSLGGDWVGKFMPDYASMLLVLMAVGLSWDGPRKLLPFCLATLGCLMKPTSISVVPLILLAPEPNKAVTRAALWSIPAFAVALCYYTKGLNYIHHFQQMPNLYFLERRPFFAGLWQYFSQVKEVSKFLLLKSYFPGGILLVLISLAAVSRSSRSNQMMASLWLVVLLQMIPVAGAAGAQALSHEYYFISLTPTLAILFLLAYEKSNITFLKFLLLLGLCVRLMDLSYMDLRPWLLSRKAINPEWRALAQCDQLRARTTSFPWHQGKVFRSPSELYPFLGVCFGEREGSKISPYGFFWRNDPIPSDCTSVQQTELLRLVTCSEKKADGG